MDVTYAKGVATDIVGADRQVADLEAFDSMNIKALVNNTTVWSNGATLSWSHAASAQGVPCSLNVALD